MGMNEYMQVDTYSSTVTARQLFWIDYVGICCKATIEFGRCKAPSHPLLATYTVWAFWKWFDVIYIKMLNIKLVLITVFQRIEFAPFSNEWPTIAFHYSEIPSFSDWTSGQSKNLKKESKILTRAFQITYFILIWVYRWIQFFWILNPFFSYEHQPSEVQSDQAMN